MANTTNLTPERVLPNAYPVVAYAFMQDNVAASQSNVQLAVTEVASAAGIAVDGYTMPWGGTIVGITADLSAAATAGSLTVGATVGGTEQADPTLSITTETTKSDTALRSVAAVDAGDILGAEITTSSDWDGTTADLVVVVYVMFEVTGV